MRRLLSILILVAITGCGGDGAESTPAVPDPYGLASLVLPGSEQEILGVLEAMPTEISGFAKAAGDSGLLVAYGGLNTLVAIPFPAGGGISLAEDLSRFPSEPGASVETSQLDPASDMLWMVGSFTDQGGAGVVYVAVWGAPDGDWAFNASAETPEMRDALVRAFVEAIGG
jgi:hypothetical protein